jgi:hypothetical protein
MKNLFSDKSPPPDRYDMWFCGKYVPEMSRTELIDIITYLLDHIEHLKEDKQQLYKLLEK